MKKLLILSFIIVAETLASTAFAFTSDNQSVVYQQLQTNTANFYSSTNQAFQIPNFLYGEPLLQPQPDESFEQMVDRFFRMYPATFHNITITDFRVEIEHPKDRTITQVHLFQTYQEVPVFGAEVILTFNEQRELISYLGKYIPNLTVSTAPISQPNEIKQIVANDLETGIITQEPKLFIFNRGVLTDQSEQTRLAWRLATHGWVYFIDAHTKEIIYQYEDVDSALNRTVYSGGGGTPTLPGTLVISEGDDTSLVSDVDAVAAYNYSEDVYNYFYGNFSLDSYDDAGSEMISTVDYATSNLARWCNYLKIQDEDECPSFQGVLFYAGYTVLDIAAHEWAHAVDDYAVQDTDNELYGLTMADQSGALNESYSDIFGVLIEEEYGTELDWDIGEDSPSGVIRNLADPTTSATPQPDEWSEYDDTQDSHYNSGIPNKAAYLIMRESSDGSEEFNSVYVTGLGLDKAENIFYYTLRDELITSATFADNYNALMQTCLTLEVITIDDSDCESIFDAYAASGVNTDTSFALARISASATSGTGPLTITFDGADSVGINSTISSYTWDFGDGSTDSGGAVSYTYSNPGTYTVTLTVIDSGGSVADTTITITVYATGTISSDTTWYNEYSPYIIYGSTSVNSGVTLTIEPGTIIKFYNTSSYFTVSGSLDAQGTSTEPIIFTSYKDDNNGGDTNGDGDDSTPAAGDWHYFRTAGSGATALLDYVTIQYGGYTGTSYDYGMFLIDDNTASVTVDNSTVQYSQYYTMQIETGSTSTISNSTISNTNSQSGVYSTGGTTTLTGNTISATNSYGLYVYNSSPTIDENTFIDSGYGIFVTGTSSAPTITNNTFTDNSYPIYLSNITTGTSLSSNTGSGNDVNGIMVSGINGDIEFNMDNDLLYVPYLLSIPSGDTLTIAPGTIIKFYPSSVNYSLVSGTLNALGTTSDPIIFTSYYDDTYGGDTNEDGAITSPSAGEWDYISFGNTSSVNLSYVTIEYGGQYRSSGTDDPMVLVQSDAVTITNSTFAYSDYDVIQINGASPSISNSSFSYPGSNSAADRVIYVTGGSPTFDGNTITNGDFGVYTTSAATPILTHNLIYDNTYGLYNVDSSVNITAENNWWGDASGPYHATSNPTGLGDTVSDYVDFDPWLTSEDYTPPSDVTLSTTRKDVWAQTITLNWANPTDSDFDHVQIDRTDVTAGTTTTLSSSETGTSYIDTTPSYNTTYTYTLYAVDTSGNVSTGVTTTNQRLRNPAPTNLTLTAGDTTITATWNASSAPAATLGGYIVYYGTSRTSLTNTIDVGNVTNYTITGLSNYTRYYVAVTAYNKAGTESDLSQIRATRPHP